MRFTTAPRAPRPDIDGKRCARPVGRPYGRRRRLRASRRPRPTGRPGRTGLSTVGSHSRTPGRNPGRSCDATRGPESTVRGRDERVRRRAGDGETTTAVEERKGPEERARRRVHSRPARLGETARSAHGAHVDGDRTGHTGRHERRRRDRRDATPGDAGRAGTDATLDAGVRRCTGLACAGSGARERTAGGFTSLPGTSEGVTEGVGRVGDEPSASPPGPPAGRVADGHQPDRIESDWIGPDQPDRIGPGRSKWPKRDVRGARHGSR